VFRLCQDVFSDGQDLVEFSDALYANIIADATAMSLDEMFDTIG
jgi:hypothetical protein